MTDAPGSVPVNPAATILLLRDEPAFQVLMVRRHHEVEFASGALVFPGGRTHRGDHDPAWADYAVGWSDLEPAQRSLRIAAIREAFEEAGILLARRANGEPLQGEACPLEVRRAVDAGEAEFLDVVRQLGVRLDLAALAVFARWITPPGPRKRFDTWFFAAKAPADQLAACDGRETVDAEWIAPATALRLAEAGERKVVFVTRMNLKLLGEAAAAEDAVRRAEARPLVTVQTRIEQREDGRRVLVLPPEAGYGHVEEPIERAGG
jgi:8-oxo-dGTP pyrophosphatase MutT (NUDIX family)